MIIELARPVWQSPHAKEPDHKKQQDSSIPIRFPARNFLDEYFGKARRAT